MNLNFVMLNQKSELLSYREAILGLFHACFGKGLDQATWDWAYLDNPMGEPIVSLCFDENRLVGHYALIPYDLIHGGCKLRAYLSMTTMVDAQYRKCGLFVDQAQRVFAKAREAGAEIVFGFPNAKSAPGFRKRLGWTLDTPDFVANVTVKELATSSRFQETLLDPTLVRIAKNDSAFLEWRLAKPQQKYQNSGTLILKSYQDQIDIVFCDRIEDEDFDALSKVNILIDARVDDLKPHSVFEYQFGYLPLTENAVGLKFKKDLILSDVF